MLDLTIFLEVETGEIKNIFGGAALMFIGGLM